MTFLYRVRILFISTLLVACSSTAELAAQEQTLTEAPEIVSMATQASVVPLTICLGQEPNTLFPYGNLNNAARQVLQAIYDGPIDQLAYQHSPVILEALPTLENGGVQIQQAEVRAGDRVLSQDGTPITLGSGAEIRPSGCVGGDCVVVYSNGEVSMDQLLVTFRLKAGLTWSDGVPLTAGDSVYAHRINAEPNNYASRFRIERTASYQAVDELTIVWTGLPGYISADHLENFWPPAPEHIWGALDPAALNEDPIASQNPLGWGAYTVGSWEAGQEIRLSSNSNYFRASEGLPLHDELVFRFVGQDGPSNLARLQSGECDLLGPDTGLGNVMQEVEALREVGDAQIVFGQGDQWWHLDIGIQHVDYDDGYNQGLGDRPNYFADTRVRQAIAQCIDRQALVEEITWGQGGVMDSFVGQSHPVSNDQTSTHGYDPQAAAILLESIGWLPGEDGVRISQGVAGMLDGTRFELNYMTSDAPQELAIADLVAADLRSCGINVNVQAQAAATLFNPGPAGPLFGRQFDLAQFAWPLEGQPACYLYLNEAIPGDDLNVHRYGWGGWNASGWADPDFDLACKTARNSLPGQDAYLAGHQNAQAIFADNLPVIPFFAEMDFVVGRADLCGLDFDDTAGFMWNVESLGFGEYCP